MDYEIFLRAQGRLRAHFVPLTLVGMRAAGLCVDNIVNTLREAKRAQIKNQVLPKWIAEINFLFRVGRVYLGRVAHWVLDPFASKINWPGRKMLA
jgi:hypothetical protein